MIHEYTYTIHTTLCNGKISELVDKRMQTLGGKIAKEQTRYAYDLNKSYYSTGGIANTYDGKIDMCLQFIPHKLITHNYLRDCLPLSSLLSGSNRFAGLPFAPAASAQYSTALTGNTATITVANKDKKIIYRIVLQLNPSKNYLPEKMTCYDMQKNSQFPTDEAEVAEWSEISSGIWLPKKTLIYGYDPKRLEKGKQAMIREYMISINECTVSPPCDPASFVVTQHAPGTTVYEVTNSGKISNTYNVPKKSIANVDGKAKVYYIFIALFSVLIIIMVVYLAKKYIANKRKLGAKSHA